jgi:hypothetical protein
VFELRYGATGDVATLQVVRVAAEPQTSAMLQMLLAGALLIVAAAVTQVGRSSGLRDWISAYPQLVLALLGVVALLVPGYLWLGVLLLACTLLVTLHSPWKARA